MRKRNPLYYNLKHYSSDRTDGKGKLALGRELARYRKLGLEGTEEGILSWFNMIVQLAQPLRGESATMHPARGAHDWREFQRNLSDVLDENEFYWGLGETFRDVWASNRSGDVFRSTIYALQDYFTDSTKALCKLKGLDFNALILGQRYPEIRKILLYRKEFVDKLIEGISKQGKRSIPFALVIPYGLYSLTGSQLTPFMMLHDLFEVAYSTYEIEVLRNKYQPLSQTIDEYKAVVEAGGGDWHSSRSYDTATVKLYAFPKIASVLSEMRMMLTDSEGKWTVIPRTKHVKQWLKAARNFDDLDYNITGSYAQAAHSEKIKAFLKTYLKSPIGNIDVLSEFCALWCIKQKWKPNHFIVVANTYLNGKFPQASNQSVDVPELIAQLKPLMFQVIRFIIQAGVISIHPMSDLSRDRVDQDPLDFRKDEIPQEIIDAVDQKYGRYE